MPPASFRTLGRSGLIVSPLALGTMTFGPQRWGSPDDASQAIFNAYVDAGGNFIDTADVYSGGRSEELLGTFIAARSLRDKLVLATKSAFNPQPGNPNAGGNGRKNIHRALEGSLRRLQTDYIDLYWTHIWDTVTPIDEVLETLACLQRAGKIRYFGLSNVPAWYAARAATFAQAHATPGPIALQLEYSLVSRDIEREHIPAVRECGLGITAWGPLSSGFLTGKYEREPLEATANAPAGEGRFEARKHHRPFSERDWQALNALTTIAHELSRPPAEIALAWASAQPGITALILGATTPDQLRGNLASLELTLTPEHLRTLDQASALDPAPPFGPPLRRMIFGNTDVQPLL